MEQQGDVLLYQSNDNGEINVVDGLVQMSGGLATSAYLSLFGGQEQDDGIGDNPRDWWGNIDEPPDAQYRSQTQYLLRSIPAIPANLRRIEDAANTDLAWMATTGAASAISVDASMPALNRVKITVNIDGDSTLEFEENWQADL